jgi:hypothetical protein
MLVALSGLYQFISQSFTNAELTQTFLVASSLAFAGVLVLPSAWYAWKDYAYPQSSHKPLHEPRDYTLALTLLVLVMVTGALLMGNWVSQNEQLAWIILPVLNIIATGLPALWLIYIGTRGLISSPPRYRWGVFASGLALSPFLILLLELFALIGLLILIMVWIMLDPNISSQLTNLISRFQYITPDPEEILKILSPILLHPGVLFLAFAFISVIVPLIEEALKPLGVWLLARNKISPAQGFAFGVLCGAGFGLFENLGNTSAGGDLWVVLASTRISTLLLHCLTTGLVGWALASAWGQRRYLRLGFTYASVVFLHGLWNGMAVLSSVSSLETQFNLDLPGNLAQYGNLATIGIVALGAFNLVLFIGFSTYLRSSQISHPQLSTEVAHPLPSPGSQSGNAQPDDPSSAALLNSSLPPTTAASPDSSSEKDTFFPKDNPPPTDETL